MELPNSWKLKAMSLANKRVAITRDLRKAAQFAQVLYNHQATPLIYPCIEIVPPNSTDELDEYIRQLGVGEFDWMVFASQNAVEAVWDRLKNIGLSTELANVVKCAAVGTATASAAKEAFGFKEIVVPEVYRSKELVKIFEGWSGQRVFVPKSKIGKPQISNKLLSVGAKVCEVVAYDTQKATGGVDLPALVKKREVDAIAFASPSAVKFFKQRFIEESGVIESLESLCIACIGDVTRDAAVNSGLRVDVVPSEHTIEKLVEGLSQYFR